MSTLAYEDQWGEIIQRPKADCVEIRWFDATVSMESDDFHRFLSQFAQVVERAGCSGCLVDANAFAMPRERMRTGWRDRHIVPRYNAAGVKRFAFHVPSGMPAIGAPPVKEGPAQYQTAYFGTRAEALAWLAS